MFLKRDYEYITNNISLYFASMYRSSIDYWVIFNIG